MMRHSCSPFQLSEIIPLVLKRLSWCLLLCSIAISYYHAQESWCHQLWVQPGLHRLCTLLMIFLSPILHIHYWKKIFVSSVKMFLIITVIASSSGAREKHGLLRLNFKKMSWNFIFLWAVGMTILCFQSVNYSHGSELTNNPKCNC